MVYMYRNLGLIVNLTQLPLELVDSYGALLLAHFTESNMFLYLSTNDSKYIEASLPTLEALEYLAEKSLCGIAGVKSLSVDLEFATMGDNMESFVLAETLKYMWLVFNPEQVSAHEGLVGRTSAGLVLF